MASYYSAGATSASVGACQANGRNGKTAVTAVGVAPEAMTRNVLPEQPTKGDGVNVVRTEHVHPAADGPKDRDGERQEESERAADIPAGSAGGQSFYEQARRRRNRDLRDLIRAQADVGGILDLAVARGEFWDAVSLSTALHTAAWKHREGSGRIDFDDDPRWLTTWSLLRRKLAIGEARNLANNAWSLASLVCQDMQLFGEIERLVSARATELKIQEVSNTCWAFATVKWQDMKLYERLAAEIQAKAADGVNQDLTNTMWAFATVLYTDASTFELLCGLAALHAPEFKPQELANAFWAMATMTHDYEALAYRLSKHALTAFPEFLPQNLANFVWAYAKLAYDDELVAMRVQHEASLKMTRFSPQDLSTTIWAFSTMLYRNDPFLERCLDAVHAHSKPSQQGGLQAQHTSNTLWALAAVAYYDSKYFPHLAELGRSQRFQFKPQELSNTIWACAVVLHRDQPLTHDLAQEAADRMDDFDIQGIGNSLWAASQLDCSLSALYDATWARVSDRTFLVRCTEKCFSMLVYAFFKSGRQDTAWDLLDRVIAASVDPGVAALGTWLHWCRQRRPDLRRELKVMCQLGRLRPCRHLAAAVLHAAALQLEVQGQKKAAAALLTRVEAHSGGNVLTAILRGRLGYLGGSSASRENEAEHWLNDVNTWQMVGKVGVNPRCDYDKECQVLRHVLATAKKGDPESVIRSIESFSINGSRWLKIAGDEKGAVLDDLVELLTPHEPKLVVEFGCYVGYSSCRMARLLRPKGGRVVSVEVDPVHACIARNVLEFAGLADYVAIFVGHSEDAIPHLREACQGAPIDVVFMDQKGTRFHIDLYALESEGLLADGCVVAADNVLKPGAPHFLWHLQEKEKYNLVVVSLREFAAAAIEDWMSIAHLRPGMRDAVPHTDASTPTAALAELAFISDRARQRSCASRTLGEMAEAEWACHSQDLRQLYAATGIRPREVEISRREDGSPYVAWPADVLARSRKRAA